MFVDTATVTIQAGKGGELVSTDLLLDQFADVLRNKMVMAQLGMQLLTGLEHMAEIALQQLKAVLDAYAAHDDHAAYAVRQRDDEIDALYTSLFRELLTYMMEDPRNITFCTHLLFCAKNIERIGDHTTNIAETIHYLITGDSLDVNRPKLDTTNIEVEAITGN